MDDLGRHEGVPETIRQLTQVSFLVRLVALLVSFVVSVGQPLMGSDALAVLVIGGLSFAGLIQTRMLDIVRRHPIVALADALIVAAVVALNGSTSPLVLAALTTALLVGLWVAARAGLIVIVSLVLLYWVGLTTAPPPSGAMFVMVMVVPFVYVTLWLLGIVVARASVRQQLTDLVTRDATVTAAASEERARLARELHDSLAKTLQGLSLTAAAMPTLIETNPARAMDAARQIQTMGAEAVRQVRGVMTGLRQATSQLPLHVAATHRVSLWQSDWPSSVAMNIEEVDTTDEAVRFELLAILDEALDNIRRHAGPTPVLVALTRLDGDITLVVEDHGKGADHAHVEAARGAGHHGVTGMKERMIRVGGSCQWVSTPGRGTRVECRVQADGLVESRKPGHERTSTS